jgi:UDP-N-acetylmuramate dehydrogenase
MGFVLTRSHSPPLSSLTTLRLGGPATAFVKAAEEREVVTGVRAADALGHRLCVIGGGSNIVVADEGFDGMVVQVATQGLERTRRDDETVHVSVAAGEDWDSFVVACIENDLAGVETLSGIPGTVGGTPLQNVGAYGQEVRETITSVRAYDRQRHAVVDVPNSSCAFGYRDSVFKRTAGRFVVLSVTFALRITATVTLPRSKHFGNEEGQDDRRFELEHIREQVLDKRRERGMVLDADDHDTWSAGSFFQNPTLGCDDFDALKRRASERLGSGTKVPIAEGGGGLTRIHAGWLIEKAGIKKGHPLPACPNAAVSVSTKHTLALTNRGRGTTRELMDLAREIAGRVTAVFGVSLVPEPTFVGHAWSPPPG